jgi:RNA polymerase sigma-70 factor (ECF subfamily)
MDTYKKAEASNGPSRDQAPRLDSFTQGFVRKCARQLAGKFGFKRQDRDEIEQRLYLKLARHLHAADPNDPKWKAFVAITVRRHLASMIRDSQAEKRDHRRTCSIHVQIDTDEGPVDLADTISEREIPSRRGRAKRSPQELAELTLDVRDCLAELTDEKQHEYCERLMHDSISQVARDVDIPRTTLNGRLDKVRQRFEERELREYL